jgi:hypothetical protein
VTARVGEMDPASCEEWLEGQPDWEALLWRLVNVPSAEWEFTRQEAVRQRRQWVSHAEEGALQAAAAIELARDVAAEAVQDLTAAARAAADGSLAELLAAYYHVAARRAQSSMGRLIVGTQAVVAAETTKTVKQQLSYYYRGLPQWIEDEVDPLALGPVARQVAEVGQRVQQQMEALCRDMEQELHKRVRAEAGSQAPPAGGLAEPPEARPNWATAASLSAERTSLISVVALAAARPHAAWATLIQRPLRAWLPSVAQLCAPLVCGPGTGGVPPAAARRQRRAGGPRCVPSSGGH